MEMIGDILKAKGDQVFSVGPETKTTEALALMAEKNIGAVLVVDEFHTIQGIFSERDFARKIVQSQKAPPEIQVKELMTTKIYYIRTEQTIEECMALMTRNKFRHMPVLHEGKLAGLVSIGDIVKTLISEKDYMIDQLEHYISGSL